VLRDAWTSAGEALAELQQRIDYRSRRASNGAHDTRVSPESTRCAPMRYHQLRDEEQRLSGSCRRGCSRPDRLRTLESSLDVTAHRTVREEFDAAVDRALPIVGGQTD